MYNNKNTMQVSEIDFDEDFTLLMALPSFVRDYLLMESPICYNIQNIIDHKGHNYLTWREVLDQIKQVNQEDHRKMFNGVHPSLDSPRAAW